MIVAAVPQKTGNATSSVPPIMESTRDEPFQSPGNGFYYHDAAVNHDSDGKVTNPLKDSMSSERLNKCISSSGDHMENGIAVRIINVAETVHQEEK